MHSFKCPITGELLKDPVQTVDGQVYERSGIEEWFRRGYRTSPATGAALECTDLTSNAALRRAIEEYT